MKIAFSPPFGAWQDERSTEELLLDLHQSRRSRIDSPSLSPSLLDTGLQLLNWH